MSLFLFLTSILVLPLRGLAQDTPAQCYTPNGALTQYTGGSLHISLHPCPAGADGYATCCAEGDTCSPDRLCYNAGGNNVWRNFCTDPTWKSASCSPLCQGTADWDANPVQITPCQDGMMCCDANNTQCCNNHQGSYAFQGVPINATSDTSPPNVHAKKITGGQIAGIAIGAVAIILLSAVLVLLVMRFRTDRKGKAGLKRIETPDFRTHIPQAPPSAPAASMTFTAPSLHSHPSTRSHHVGSPDRERPLPAIPGSPRNVHELGGGQGVSRFEVSGHSVWGDKKY